MLKIFAPAKINLHLHVTGKKPDGYHLLDSLVCFADIGDTLYFEPARGFNFKIEGNFATHLTQNDIDSSPASGNTVVRAAWALANTLARELNVAITLQKNLPPGGGIGGGSADAAACLWGLCQFWNLNLPTDYLHNLALKIGSDVPVCMKSLPAIMQGTGDIILAAPELPEIPIVMIWPQQPASTPDVFRSLEMPKFSEAVTFKKNYEDIPQLVADLNLQTRNDLDGAAQKLFPVIGLALQNLRDNKECLLARMSGSGSTVFGIFESEEKSAEAVEAILKAHPEWWVRHGWLNRIARY